MKRTILVMVAVLSVACVQADPQERVGEATDELTYGPTQPAEFQVGPQPKMIEGPFNTPESCAMGPDGRWYFSNAMPVTGSLAVPDGLATITRFTAKGKAVPGEQLSFESTWVADGLDSPLGIAWSGDLLYVVDIPGVRRISGASESHGAVEATIILPTRGNDVAVGPSGELYVSDSPGNRIYRIDNPSGVATVTTWLQSAALAIPNGLYVEAGSLFVASLGEFSASGLQGPLLRVDLATKAITVVAPELGKLDGLTDGPGNTLMVTDVVTGALHRVDKTTGAVTTVAYIPGGLADIGAVGTTVCVPKINSNAGGLLTL